MNKKGFTLVEVLAILGVLGLIVLLVVPRISKDKKKLKEEQYDRTIKIIENAAKVYYSDNKEELKITLETLKEEKLITADLKNPMTDTAITGCVRVGKDSEGVNRYTYSTDCADKTVTLTVNLAEGSTVQSFSPTYTEGTKIELVAPTRSGHIFRYWTVTSGDSVVINNKLTIGSEASTLTAVWS